MIYLMSGISGSGKSAYINNNKSDNSIVISRDAIRFSLLNDEDEYFSKEKDVLSEYHNQIKKYTSIKYKDIDIFIDATHLTKKSRRKTLNKINDSRDDIVCIYFEPNFNKAVKQNLRRFGRSLVPTFAIKQQYGIYEKPTLDEGFKSILKLR